MNKNSVKYCVEMIKSIEFNIKYIFMKGFMEFKFLNIRHCFYNEQTYWLL